MASPQKENGYTAIANEIFEKLGNFNFLGSEFRMLICIIRKTYGFQKKEDIISLTQFEKFTGLSRPTIVSGLKNLISNHIILKSNNYFKFNKNWEEWGSKAVLTSKARLTSKAVLTRTSKHRFTATSKAGLTHKRKKERKKGILITKSSLKTMKKNKMGTYNESDNSDSYEESIDLETGQAINPKPKRQPRNKLALFIQSKFIIACKANTDKEPIRDAKGYFVILDSMKHLKEEQFEPFIDSWFSSGLPIEELVQITRCFSHNQINKWLATN